MTVGKTYDQLDERLQSWIAAQHIFFVATAPSGPASHVNLSPKDHADTPSRSWTGGPSPTWT
jgi:hypothetical protein